MGRRRARELDVNCAMRKLSLRHGSRHARGLSRCPLVPSSRKPAYWAGFDVRFGPCADIVACSIGVVLRCDRLARRSSRALRDRLAASTGSRILRIAARYRNVRWRLRLLHAGRAAAAALSPAYQQLPPRLLDNLLSLARSCRPVRSRVLVARHRMGRRDAASCALPCTQFSGGSGNPPSATTSGRDKRAHASSTPMALAVEKLHPAPDRSPKSRGGAPRGERPGWTRGAAHAPAGLRYGPRRVPRKHPSACRRSAPSSCGEGNWQSSESICLARTMKRVRMIRPSRGR